MVDNQNDPFAAPTEDAYDPFSTEATAVHNPFDVAPDTSKFDAAEKAKATKLYALENLNQNASLDDSYTDLGNGWIESNKNKIWNDLSGQEVQNLLSHVTDNYALSKDAEGNVIDAKGNLFGGYSRRLYDFGTKAQTSDEIKMGLARGDSDSARSRYIEFPSGELGADINRLNKDTLLPNDIAVMMEAVLHGRKKALQNRVIKDRYADPERTALYGGGSSEYYTNRAGLLGEEAEHVDGLGASLFKEYMDKLPRRLDKPADDKFRVHESSLINAAKGFGASFVNELVVKPLDAIGDLTGLYDLDTNGDTVAAVENAFGYDKAAADDAIHKIGGFWDVASNTEQPTAARVRAAANGMLEAFTTPELLGTSLGALLSWITPGVVLKGIGIGSKYAKTVAATDELLRAGRVTPQAAKVQKAIAFTSVDGAKAHLTKQAGFITSSLGNVNKQYEEFVANNGGVELDGAEKARWFSGRFAVQMVNQNLDKLVDFKVMQSPGVFKALVPAVRSMTEKEFGNVVGVMAKGLAKTASGAGAEAAQEYTQTTMELFNSRYGSEKFSDVESFKDFLSDDRNVREAGIASLAGAGGSAQFELVGAVGSTAALGTSKGIKALGDVKSQPETVSDESPEKFTPVVGDDETVSEEVSAERSAADTLKADNLIGAYGTLFDNDELASAILTDNPDAVNTPKLKAKLKEVVEDYASSIADVEEAEAILNNRAGTAAATEDDNDSLRTLQRVKRELLSNAMDDEEGLLLGSGYNPEDIVEEFFDTVDVKDGKLLTTREEELRLIKYAKDNDIPRLRFETIRKGRIDGKDAATVQEEALGTGEKSASAYRRELKRLVSTPNVSKKLVSEQIGKIDHFLHSQESRSKAYNSVLDTVNIEIAKYNKLPKGDALRSAKAKSIVKLGDSIPGYPGTFVNVTKNKETGNLSVNKNSIALGKSIEDTITYLERTKTRYSKKVNTILGEDVLTNQAQGIAVRPTNSKFSANREKDLAFYDKRKVNKVIVDESAPSAVWKPSGDYNKDNSSKINTGSYTKDDIVLINSEAKSFGKGENKALRAEINKVFKAGATIIVDRQVSRDQTPNMSPLNKLLKSYHMIKVGEGSGDTLRYVPSAQAKVIKAEESAAKQTVKDNNAIKNRAHRAIGLSRKAGDLDKAVEDGTITEARKNRIEESIDAALPLFGDDLTKLEANYDNTVKKQTEKLKKELTEVSNLHGKESPQFAELLSSMYTSRNNLNAAVSAAFDTFIVEDEEATAAKEADEKATTAASKELSDWNAASIAAKKGDVNLDTWIKDNVANPKGVMEEILKNSSGAGTTRTYVFNKDGERDFKPPVKTLETLFSKIPDGGLYQVLDRDPANYITVGSVTPLNSLSAGQLRTDGSEYVEFNELVDGAVELVEKAVRAPSIVYKGGDSILDLSDSPALSMIFDKDLNVNENIAVALHIGLNNYIRNSGYLLHKGSKNKKDIAELLGKSETQVTKEMVALLSDKGMLYKTVADSIGKDVVSMLGLQRDAKSDSDAQAFAALVADLGQTALIMGVADGNLKIDNTLSSAKYAKVVLGKGNEVLGEGNNAKIIFIEAADGTEDAFDVISATSKEIESLIPGSNSTRRPPSLVPLTDSQKKTSLSKIRNERLGVKIADESADALEELMDTEWTADLSAMRNMLEDEELIKARLGFIEIDPENPAYEELPFEKKQVQESINRRLDNSFEEMRILTGEHTEKSGVSLWFDYFFSKNGRFFIDSNTIQPQTEKHLHRFTTQPKSHTFDYTVKRTKSGKVFSIGNVDVTDKVHYALAQAFGAATDKKDTAKNAAFTKEIITTLDTAEKVKQARQYFLEGDSAKDAKGAPISLEEYNSLDIDLEHLGHALQGFQFLTDSVNSNSFSSSITAEFDAVTSGFGLKNLQIPILDAGESWRRKVGIIHSDDEILSQTDIVSTDGQGDADMEQGLGAVSMNDILDTGGLKDSYQTLAAQIKQLEFEEMLKGLGEFDTVTDNAYNRNLWDALSAVLPKVNEDGTVSSKLRSLFKYPFMTFNYAASIGNIRNNLLVGDMMDSLVEQMAKVDLNDNAKLNDADTALVNLMQTFVGSKGSIDQLQEDIRNEALYKVKSFSKSKTTMEKEFSVMINASYGEQVEAALMNEFAPFVAAQENINHAFKAMFEIFSVEFDEKLLEARANGAVTVADERKILEDLKNKWPAIKGPLSRMEDDINSGGVGVYATETSSPWGVYSRRKAVRAKLSYEMQDEIGQKDIRVSPMLKHLAAAVSAGSVIPIHYIDGAVMAKTVTGSKKSGVDGITTIHDAIMPPMLGKDGIDGWGVAQQEYNKEALEVNSEYSFVHEINAQLQKVVAEALSSSNEDYSTRDVVVDKDLTLSLVDYAEMVSSNFSTFANDVSAARNALYKSFDGRGVHVMHMAGTENGVYVGKPGGVNFTPVEDVPVPEYTKPLVDKAKLETANNKADGLNCGK